MVALDEAADLRLSRRCVEKLCTYWSEQLVAAWVACCPGSEPQDMACNEVEFLQILLKIGNLP